ncbi:unnamed protein product [Bursaphelenchus okinawaensis]|uniref:Uncharacterized protein n=1 Tax=Bursaphelenchus okinawaensis TaxID=465554 RepID=A0A811L612_9BILA|nr:unnamed protein product [Bursaphelenchus okinawaensis]CAG9118202.1 unnamed protein product [Bursaphelenchus okinawaensis]
MIFRRILSFSIVTPLLLQVFSNNHSHEHHFDYSLIDPIAYCIDIARHEALYTLQELVYNGFADIPRDVYRIAGYIADCTKFPSAFKKQYDEILLQMEETFDRFYTGGACMQYLIEDVKEICLIKSSLKKSDINSTNIQKFCGPLMHLILPCIFYHVNELCPYNGEIMKLVTYMPFYFTEAVTPNTVFEEAPNSTNQCMNIFDKSLVQTFNMLYMDEETREENKHSESKIIYDYLLKDFINFAKGVSNGQ